MASDYHLSQILKFLRDKRIKMSSHNEWLLGCYEYYLSENQSVVNNLPELMNFVYEQWLLADLRDVAEACLPENIMGVEKVMLNDVYTLQVDVMVNIAESFYSQIQKIRRLASENLEVTETEQQPWEPKAKRMLKLTCTDGVHQVYGMEYELIPVLREPYIPGCKILVTGPVECRQGVILLTPRNLTLLGGEVDSLITENAQINVLTKKLNEVGPGGEISETVSTISDRSGGHSNSTRAVDSRLSYSIPTSVSRSNLQESITFTQFNDDEMDDDDEIFLSDRLDEVENLLNVRDENNSERRHQDNNSTLVDGSGDNSLSVVREGLPVISSTLSGHLNSELVVNNSSSPMDEQIVPTNRPSVIDLFTQPENIIVNTSTSKSSFLCSNLCLNTTVGALRRLHECNAMRLDITYNCKARVTKLRSKPRIKNEKWLMSVDMSDDDVSLEVTFHGSFLDGIFGYTALEVLSQKDRIKSNESVKLKIDQIVKEGASKILSLQGEFFVKCLPNSDLPTVMRVHETTN